MAIKILFQKELTIDLNAYYKQFPRKLRQQIDETVMALVSGTKPQATSVLANTTRLWAKHGDGKRLTHDEREARLTKSPIRGDMLVAFNALHKAHDGKAFTMKAAKATLVKAGVKDEEASTVLAKLWANRNLDVMLLQAKNNE